MFWRRLRKALLVVAVGAVVVKLIAVLRGSPAPVFSTRPGDDDRARPQEPPRPRSAGGTRTSAAPASTPMVASTGPAGTHAEAPAWDAPIVPVEQTWREPVDGACPEGFPVKVKLRSGIYHLPGMTAYGRTSPDRCYPTPEAAAADGLRAAKR